MRSLLKDHQEISIQEQAHGVLKYLAGILRIGGGDGIDYRGMQVDRLDQLIRVSFNAHEAKRQEGNDYFFEKCRKVLVA